MFELTGKVALVAGGAGYLALPACAALARQGAAVAVADIAAGSIERAVAAVAEAAPGARALGIVMDIGDEAAVRAAVERTVAEFGGLHIVVNAAAIPSVGKLVEEVSAEEFEATLRVNLTGALLLAKEAARAMTAGGSIIFISSMYGQVAPDPRIYAAPMTPNPLDYGAAKAGIIQMARYLAVRWGSRGIRVNAIAPGPFPKPEVQRSFPDFIERLAAKTALGRIGRQDEIAGAVVFLASDEAAYVTGETLAVNGGWTAW